MSQAISIADLKSFGCLTRELILTEYKNLLSKAQTLQHTFYFNCYKVIVKAMLEALGGFKSNIARRPHFCESKVSY